MARYTGPKEKIERRLGSKLFLKGERSLSSKSAIVRRPYPPGPHGKKFRGRLSEYGQQLRSKQKVRNTYRMLERQFGNWVEDAIVGKEDATTALVKKLERRLDNVVYRLGIGQSRDQARQLVNHGHILVNNKKVSIPSYQISVGDSITIREGSKKATFFTSLAPQWLKKYEAPVWLKFDNNTIVGSVNRLPNLEDSGLDLKDIQSIIEFYSR